MTELVGASDDNLARRILDAAAAATQIPLLSTARPDLDMDGAYRIADAVLARREARGEMPVGWKIGFTNRTIWDEYDVHAPIWGPMYSTTLAPFADGGTAGTISLAGLSEPRLEPEIYLRIGRRPEPAMDDAALMACIDAVGHGVEIVQSLFAGWHFRAVDTVAALALHGLYRSAPAVPVETGERDRWRKRLADFSIRLFRDGEAVDAGRAANILGVGPLAALRELVAGLEGRPLRRGIEPGDIVTTGTVTRAFAVRPGERWRTEVEGLPLPVIDATFVA